MAIKHVSQRETVEVFLSDRRVVASEAESVIPKGYRPATLEEVALRYRHDANFRQELYNKGTAWTSQKGLGSSGYHEISEDGKFSGVSQSRYYKELSPERRSYHYKGSGSVAVGVYDFIYRFRGLNVNADFGASDVARVAYVKAEPLQAVKRE